MDGQPIFRVAPHALNTTSSSFPLHHILSGSFRSISLFLLAFSPVHRTLSLVQRVPAFGPHQYLTRNERGDRVYATSWAMPPALSCWGIEKGVDDAAWRVEHINTAPITATSSYISIPAPYTHLYSAGGPTGEVHAIDPDSGGFGDRVQQLLFVRDSELEEADKTRVALRYGSHAVELSSRGHAFIPVLGTNSIRMYTVDRTAGHLTLLSDTKSPRAHDGPRHVVVSPDGNVLYSVTEHTSFVDVYNVTDAALDHLQSISILPPGSDPADFRGDTLRLCPPTPQSPTPRHLFATTRGSNTSHKGFLAVFAILPSGLLDAADGSKTERWQTPTSGGKANAIELRSKSPQDDRVGGGDGADGVWIVLTDDEPEAGGLWVLEWDGEGTGGVKIVAEWSGEREETMDGASHAVWLD